MHCEVEFSCSNVNKCTGIQEVYICTKKNCYVVLHECYAASNNVHYSQTSTALLS